MSETSFEQITNEEERERRIETARKAMREDIKAIHEMLAETDKNWDDLIVQARQAGWSEDKLKRLGTFQGLVDIMFEEADQLAGEIEQKKK